MLANGADKLIVHSQSLNELQRRRNAKITSFWMEELLIKERERSEQSEAKRIWILYLVKEGWSIGFGLA